MNRFKMMQGEKTPKSFKPRKPKVITMRSIIAEENVPGQGQEEISIDDIIDFLVHLKTTERDRGAFQTHIIFYGGGFGDAEIISKRYETSADIAAREAKKIKAAERKAAREAAKQLVEEKARALKQRELKKQLLKKHKGKVMQQRQWSQP